MEKLLKNFPCKKLGTNLKNNYIMKNEKLIKFIPLLEAYDFPYSVEEELAIAEINTHYNADILYIDWSDGDDLSETKAWLLETFGEEIKKYTQFAIKPT